MYRKTIMFPYRNNKLRHEGKKKKFKRTNTDEIKVRSSVEEGQNLCGIGFLEIL